MRKTVFFIIIFSFVSTLLIYSNDNTILRVDPQGHRGNIWKAIVSSDGRYIVTCSDDKTIRVWDVEREKEVRKILGQIGDRSYGKIYAIALSPDNSILAAGGCLDSEPSQQKGLIRLYNFATGELIQTLQFHTDSVNDLSFSSDGRYLVSCSHDSKVAVWNAENNFTREYTFSDHEGHVYGVRVFKYQNDYRIVSVGLDYNIFLYSLNDNMRIGSASVYDEIDSIAVSEEKGLIAVNDWTGYAFIYDFNLNRIEKILDDTQPAGLAFSPGGDYLLAGNAQYPYSCICYDVNNDYRYYLTNNEFSDLVMAVAFISDTKAVIAGGENHAVGIWDLTTNETVMLQGEGSQVWNVGINGKEIYFGNEPHDYYDTGEADRVFSLTDFTVSEGPFRNSEINGIFKSYNGYTLSRYEGGDYGFEMAKLVIKKNGSYTSDIVRDGLTGYEHTVCGFSDSGLIISGGHNGYLAVYNTAGRLEAELLGHESKILSLACENNILVSGSEDQTIRIWNLDDIESSTNQKIYPMLSVFVSNDNEWVVWSRSGYYYSSIEGDRFVGFHLNQGDNREALFYSSEKFYDTYYRPDIIREIIGMENEDTALEELDAERGLVIENLLPPIILPYNTESRIVTDDDEIELSFILKDQSDFKATELFILLNGRPVTGNLVENSYSGSIKNITERIPITENYNIITVIAKNSCASSNPLEVIVEKGGSGEDFSKPVLYILSIGVSEYADSELNLEYADDDAESIPEIMDRNEGTIYRNIESRLLVNSEADKESIIESLGWIRNRATQNDIALIFIAGHGINDNEGNYYYLNYDVNIENINKSAVPWIKFKEVVTTIPSKVIFIIDTCHSGNVWGKLSTDSSYYTSALKSITSQGTGQIIMTAATTDDSSYEDYKWSHGAFTYAIIEALGDGLADYDNDQLISMKEFDFYVTMRVKNITDGLQQPTTIIPDSIPDFNIGVK